MIKNNWCTTMGVLCLILSGCIGRNIPPADIYTISPPQLIQTTALAQEKKERRSVVITLAPIRASRAFAGSDIVYSHTRYERNSYAHSRWSDAPARLLQLFFQDVLVNSVDIFTVLPATSLARADFTLESTLHDFSHHINKDKTSSGVMRIHFYLVDNVKKKVRASREFSSVVPVSSCDARGAATALNKAAMNIAGDLTSWLLEHHRFAEFSTYQ